MVGFVLTTSLCAVERESSNYSISTDVLDAGGHRSRSQNFNHDGSLGGIAGLSNSSSVTAGKSGYAGQLYDPAGFLLFASQLTFDEGSAVQIDGVTQFDDGTVLTESASAVAWLVEEGPLSINSSGQVVASTVYQDEGGLVSGLFKDFNASISLTVANSDPDNFNSYGADGIDDAWQISYFGLPPNSLAGPGKDPDGDFQTNLFEYLALSDPINAASFFRIEVRPVDGEALKREVVFSPVFASRTYTVESSRDFTGGAFQPLVSAAFSDRRGVRTVTDVMTTVDQHFFYQIRISVD